MRRWRPFQAGDGAVIFGGPLQVRFPDPREPRQVSVIVQVERFDAGGQRVGGDALDERLGETGVFQVPECQRTALRAPAI